MSGETMQIGEAAARAGVNIQTLHYYERRGLLFPTRTLSNYRRYTTESVRRVRFIKHAQELGFTLDEIKELLALRVDSKAKCADVLRRAESKIADIKARIQALRTIQKTLERLSEACTNGASAGDCPILEAFDSEEDSR